MNYEEILLNYAKYFQQSDVVESAIRTVGWKLILLLRGICDACQSVWEAVFRVLSFTQVISEKLGTYYPIWNAIFLVTILAVGTVFLYSERRPPFLKNLIITMAVVMLLPGGVQLGVQLLGIEQNVFMANGTSVADTTVISNTTDLLYLKQNGWTFESPNCFTGETIKYIDQNEQVEKKTDKVFKKYIGSYFCIVPTFSFDLGYDLWRNFGLYFLWRCYVGRKNKTNVAVSIKFILERFDYDLGFRYLARV